MTKHLVFIASGGRTGTQFLGNGLSRVIADCYSEHEPDLLLGLGWRTFSQVAKFGLWYMVPGRLLGQTGLRVLGDRLLTGSLDAATVRRRIVASRERYHRRIAEPLIVESNYQWWSLAGELHRIWPESKLIGIIRDPRTWVRSWLNQKHRYDELDKVEMLPPGRLSPARLGEAEWAGRWSEIGTFGRLAWEWRTIYRHLSGCIDAVPNARMFRFEDLFYDDGSAMADLVHFAAEHGGHRYKVADLDGFRRSVTNESQSITPEWRDWSSEQARLLDELCSDLMRRYGYGREPDWLAKLGRSAARPVPSVKDAVASPTR